MRPSLAPKKLLRKDLRHLVFLVPTMTTEARRLPLLHLYIDETGSRHPDKAQAISKHGFDWFALGGVLIREEDESEAKTKLTNFLNRWPQIRSPLHFTDIRAEKKGFAWIGKCKYAKSQRRRLSIFYERADPITDKRVEGYFHGIKDHGLAFAKNTSAKNAPLTHQDFSVVLLRIEGKHKSSRMMPQ